MKRRRSKSLVRLNVVVYTDRYSKLWFNLSSNLDFLLSPQKIVLQRLIVASRLPHHMTSRTELGGQPSLNQSFNTSLIQFSLRGNEACRFPGSMNLNKALTLFFVGVFLQLSHLCVNLQDVLITAVLTPLQEVLRALILGSVCLFPCSSLWKTPLSAKQTVHTGCHDRRTADLSILPAARRWSECCSTQSSEHHLQ